MTNPTKLLNILTFSLMIGTGATIAMEQEVKHTLMLCDKVKTAKYCTSSFHDELAPHNLPSTIKDPLIQCIITDLETKKITSYNIVAAKYLFKYDATEPLLQLELKQGRNKNNLSILARCVQNPKLDGDSFFTQLKNTLTPLYNFDSDKIMAVYTEQPGDLLFCTDSENDFIRAGIVIKKIENRKTTLIHGTNGCPNEEALIKSQFNDVTKPRIPFIFWFLKNYQCDQQETLPRDVLKLISVALQLQPSSVTLVK